MNVSILTEYSATDAAQIGALMPELSTKFTGEPIAETLLRDIIASPSHDQFVIRDDSGVIVGVATLSIVIGAGAGAKAYLNDFVVTARVRSKGYSQALWDAMITWCEERSLDLEFTSSRSREAAHRFYARNNAKLRETDVFKVLTTR